MADPDKRRLPLLQPRPSGPEDEQPSGPDDEQPSGPDDGRPSWQWVGIATVLVVVSWLPLAMLAQLLRARAVSGLVADSPQAASEAIRALPSGQRMWLGFVMAVLPLLTVVAAGLVGGMLVGRYGGRAGKREATLGGMLAAAFGLLITIRGAGGSGGLQAWTLPGLLIGLLVAVSAYGGAALGERLRDRRSQP